MCGILGLYSKNTLAADLRDVFSRIAHRGSDGYGIAVDGKQFFTREKITFRKTLAHVEGKKILLHNLHNIIGNVMQPFKGRFAANCEIYNWTALNRKHNLNAGNDSEALFLLIEKIGLERALKEIEGDYAFVYEKDGKVYLVRDVIGVKPLAYGLSRDIFCVSSEKKALDALGVNAEVMDPKEMIIFDGKRIVKKRRTFYGTVKELKKTEQEMIEEVRKKLIEAVRKRTEGIKKLGVLFSGGIDSTLIAMIAGSLGKEVICYTSAFEDKTLRKPQDLIWAKKAVGACGFMLRIKKINYNSIEKHLREVMGLIETTDVIKVGVASPFHAAASMAKRDGVKVMLSGLGSEELFAGYQRHLDVMRRKGDVNMECLKGLEMIWERDLYRDDIIMIANNVELRLPFLDADLIAYALGIPAKYKISEQQKKIILRKAAISMGLNEEVAMRPKLAAQYGSNFDKAIEKLAKRAGLRYKKDYLEKLYK